MSVRLRVKSKNIAWAIGVFIVATLVLSMVLGLLVGNLGPIELFGSIILAAVLAAWSYFRRTEW